MAALEIMMADVPVGAGGAAGSISGQGNGEGGLGFSHDVELRPGPVSVRLVAAGDGYQKAATGVVRIYEAASTRPGTP